MLTTRGLALGLGGISPNDEMSLMPGVWFFQDWKNKMRIYAYKHNGSVKEKGFHEQMASALSVR